MFKGKSMLYYDRLRILLRFSSMILSFSFIRYKSILIIYVKSSNFFVINELIYRLLNHLLNIF